MSALPIVVTLGDPAGIGPELVAKAHLQGALDGAVVIGHPAVLERGYRACGLSGPPPGAALPVVQPHSSGPAVSHAEWRELPWGQVDARCGHAVADALRTAVDWARTGRTGAIVTAPLHKEALALAGIAFPGHTEMLQAWSSDPPPPVRMMLANPELRVVLVTIHTALRSAIEALNTPLIVETIVIAHQALQSWGFEQPRIAVAGLNPHAGEGGLFGSEERDCIAPAIAQAQAMGILASGPHPPDTVFMRARHTPQRPGAYDAVVAMTHDHGLIPVKYLGVEQGVNITLGLPFVRTSPDHGTAFDIAGRGLADPSSFLAAVSMARQLSR